MIIAYLFKRIFSSSDHNLIFIAFKITILFTILYSFLDDTHFGGLERITRHIKTVSNHIKIVSHTFNNLHKGNKDLVAEKHKTEEEDDDTFLDKVFQVLLRLFNRFYFTVVTGSTVGYGDVAPKSIIARLLASIQISIMFALLLKK